MQDTSSNEKKLKAPTSFRETLDFFKEAENYEVSTEGSTVPNLLNFHRQFLNKSINRNDDMTRIPNIEDSVVRSAEEGFEKILTMFLSLKAYFIFVKALKLMGSFNAEYKPYFIVIRRTSDGVDAIWRKFGVKLPKRYRTSLRRTAKGGFPSADFKHASPEEREIICGLVEPKLALLREQTNEICTLRTLMGKFFLLSKKHNKR